MWIFIALLPMLVTVVIMKKLGYSQAAANWTGVFVEIAVIVILNLISEKKNSIKLRKKQTNNQNNAAPAAEPANKVSLSPVDSLLVYLDIDKLNSGVYGYAAGQAIAKVISPAMSEGMSISSGDSRATLNGSANEYIVAFTGKTTELNAIESTLRADTEFLTLLSASGIRKGISNEPLVDDGRVQGGQVVNYKSFCGEGFNKVWNEQKNSLSSLDIPESAVPCDWISSSEKILDAISKTWGVKVSPYQINESDAAKMEYLCPMDSNLRTENAQYVIEESTNSMFWHEFGSWLDFKYAKFLYKGKLYYINISPTVKLTQTLYDRKGDLNNMAKIMTCLSGQMGTNRNQLLLVLDGELREQISENKD